MESVTSSTWIYAAIAAAYLIAVSLHCRFLRLNKPEAWEMVEKFDPFLRNSFSGAGKYFDYLLFERKSAKETPYLIAMLLLLIGGLWALFNGLSIASS